MQKSIVISLITILSLCSFYGNCQEKEQKSPIKSLAERLVSGKSDYFIFEEIQADKGKDLFELESRNGKIIVRGNSFNSMAVGLNHYLKYYALTSVSWYANDPVQLPEYLPQIPTKIRREARCDKRFFLNYCTFGYTMVWWQWRDWERLIDWMALNGINMPLAITSQEAIWYNVWKKLGLSDQEIRSYFTGPAHLPWHRMSNLDKWGGPLPQSWLDNQLSLQKKIISRERELGMKPVLPAFAGHVPVALQMKFPKAKITQLSKWGGFDVMYRSNFLDPLDPLFRQIQKAFLTEQTKQFGTDHIYGADPFNEVKPPNWEPFYLASVSKTIYESISASDPDASWLQMSWVYFFEREDWTNPRIKSFLTAVPQNKLILLDYFCENTEVWKMTEAYFGQPFIWCYLGNFGGNSMLAGNLAEVEKRMENAFVQAGKNMWGIGSTLEGFDVNPMMYEYVFEKAWSEGPTDVNKWISTWADRRCGSPDSSTRQSWNILLDSVYTHTTRLGQATLTNARPSLAGHGNWTTDPLINYKNSDLLNAWRLMLKAPLKNRQSYHYDVVNMGRQVLGNHFAVLRDQFTEKYAKKDLPGMKKDAARMIGLLDDMDQLLATQHDFLLGPWLSQAKAMGKTAGERNYYEHNARNIITTWGAKGQSLNDYANRSWAGLTKSYYKKRWEMFFAEVVAATEKGMPFEEKAFHEKVTSFEEAWTQMHEIYPETASGDPVLIGNRMYIKYASEIDSKP